MLFSQLLSIMNLFKPVPHPKTIGEGSVFELDLIDVKLTATGPVVEDTGNQDGQGLIFFPRDPELVAIGTGKLDRLKGKDQFTGAKDPVTVTQGGPDDNPIKSPDINNLTDKTEGLTNGPHPLAVLVQAKLWQEAEGKLLDLRQ